MPAARARQPEHDLEMASRSRGLRQLGLDAIAILRMNRVTPSSAESGLGGSTGDESPMRLDSAAASVTIDRPAHDPERIRIRRDHPLSNLFGQANACASYYLPGEHEQAAGGRLSRRLPSRSSRAGPLFALPEPAADEYHRSRREAFRG
jgi:hypothetical protein